MYSGLRHRPQKGIRRESVPGGQPPLGDRTQKGVRRSRPDV